MFKSKSSEVKLLKRIQGSNSNNPIDTNCHLFFNHIHKPIPKTAYITHLTSNIILIYVHIWLKEIILHLTTTFTLQLKFEPILALQYTMVS